MHDPDGAPCGAALPDPLGPGNAPVEQMRGAASIGRLRHRVGGAIAEHALWEPGQHVAVAVSGGLDSVCLLDLLLVTQRWHGARLSVVTVDHGLHPESAAHAAFVERLAEAHRLPCQSFRLELPDPSEATAREGRYAAFEALSVDRVALGHHRDDQAETLLLQALRGAGTRGLAGMRRVRGRYVRPLLDVSRAELEAWARWRDLEWVDDPTNVESRYLRNRIRRDVLPLLEEVRPGAAAALARTAAHCAEDDACLDAMLPPGEPDCRWLAEAPRALAVRALKQAFPTARSAHVRDILRAVHRGSGEVVLPDGKRVVIDERRIVAASSVAEEDNPRG